jgi:succinate dehydrogenase / fumarate reductase flavoprotein subunit
VREDLTNVMQNYCGIMRSEKELQKCLSELERLKQDTARTKIGGNRHYNTGWQETIDLRSMRIVSEAMARSALARGEPRRPRTRGIPGDG